MRNGAGGVSTQNGTLTINPAPDLQGIAPSSADQGATREITFTGASFSAPTVGFAPNGITAVTQPGATGTSFKALVSIARDAVLGPRSVTVTNGDGGHETVTNGFNVSAGPRVTGATPPAGQNNATSPSSTVTGDGFQDGLTVALVRDAFPDIPGAGTLVPIVPVRIIDTRWSSKIGPSTSLPVQIAGADVSIPATGVSAVVMNVTVTEPTSDSYLRLFPGTDALPLASDLNYLAGQTVPNLVLVKLGSDGKVNAYNAVRSTHVIFDLVGYVPE